MSFPDYLLYRGSEPDSEFEGYERPPCEWCHTELEADDAGEFCPECQPRELLASFVITDGRVEERAL